MDIAGQYDEIRKYLVEELEKNGFGEITREAMTRLEEDSDEIYFDDDGTAFQKITERSERYLLSDFLEEVINVLETLSNDGFEKLIEKFNMFTYSEEGKIETIFVEQINEEKPYDLRSLPSYKGLITGLKRIQLEIMEEN